LTPVDLDHQAFLGNTVEEIAKDKLGILAEDGVLVVGRQEHAAVNRLAEAHGKEHEATVLFVEEAKVVGKDDEGSVRSPKGSIQPPALPRLRIQLPDHASITATSPLPGQHQHDNTATALTILQTLRTHPRSMNKLPSLRRLSDDAIRKGLAATRWRGRCDWVDVPCQGPTRTLRVLVDGAHNTLAATRLRSYIDDVLPDPDTPVTFIVGLSHSPPKTPKDVLWPLLGPSDRVIAVPFTTPIEGMPWIKPVPIEEVRSAAVGCGLADEAVIEVATLREALDAAAASDDHNLVVLTGSLYLVADLYRLCDE
jgi:folylpolyglutamate synthase